MRAETPRAFGRSVARAAALGGLALVALGCRQDMHDQPRIEAYEASAFFADGRGSRVPPEHAVARGTLREDVALFTGVDAEGVPLAVSPVALTARLVARGQDRYDVFCAPCHGRLGDGRGMVVRRGYKQPPSYHEPRLHEAPDGYYFDVMTNGFGVMSSYASQVPVEDRWAIVAYIRALQLSQNTDVGLLSAQERARLDAPPAEPVAAMHASTQGGEH